MTVALSDKQAELFRRAIDDHRKLEKLIDQMRALSQQVLLNSVEGPRTQKKKNILLNAPHPRAIRSQGCVLERLLAKER